MQEARVVEAGEVAEVEEVEARATEGGLEVEARAAGEARAVEARAVPVEARAVEARAVEARTVKARPRVVQTSRVVAGGRECAPKR